ncbi:hypothetical protein RAN53_15040 [Halomonas sp. SSL-5]|uniref:hypothetical protein n=1 Tax=Halomonas sp. SSL-5 TaxID=3065855 RepID=UPI00273A0AAE|nr:hypothetical protein [Halomonas sp. SSL-5]MDY7117662.1 hypothetical protein [Halomonas sp. SSL-5]
MTLRPLLAGMLAVWLAGCELLPQAPFELPSSRTPSGAAASASGCHAERPSFADDDCLLPEWVAFGLASQRGDRAWREAMLTRLEGTSAERRLARAVALSWGSQGQWDRASELYKADLSAAPVSLQPLLRYWLNELERRRGMAGRLSAAQSAQAQSEARSAALDEEKAELEKKLEALTAIERSINLRQQTEE